MSRPRIRSIKPEMWQDEDFGLLDPEAQLLFIGLISHADDHGRFKGSAMRVRALVWPFRGDLAIDRVQSRLFELADSGLIVMYENAGRDFIELPNWKRHQRVDKPTDSQYPSATDPDSTIPRERSRTLLLDRKGSGGDRKGPLRPTDAVAASGDAGEQWDVATIWTLYLTTRQRVLGARSTPRLTSTRRALITRRLKEWPADDIADAVQGWQHFPHNRGENERGTPFCDIELVLRDAAHIERFRDRHRELASGQGESMADLADRMTEAHQRAAA